MSFALFVLRVVLFVSSILFGLAGLEVGLYTNWVDACLLNSILLNTILLIDICSNEEETGLHLANLGIFVLIIIGTLHVM